MRTRAFSQRDDQNRDVKYSSVLHLLSNLNVGDDMHLPKESTNHFIIGTERFM